VSVGGSPPAATANSRSNTHEARSPAGVAGRTSLKRWINATSYALAKCAIRTSDASPNTGSRAGRRCRSMRMNGPYTRHHLASGESTPPGKRALAGTADAAVRSRSLSCAAGCQSRCQSTGRTPADCSAIQ
jgi:hypothetical protein